MSDVGREASAFPSLLLGAVLLCAGSGCDDSWHPGGDTRPNIVLVVIDTLRADHTGPYGYARNTTPVLDDLARKGTVFERAYTHCPWTEPSIASIMTGRHPKDHGVANWGDRLSQDAVTLGEVFRDNGYRTEGYVSHVILKPGMGFGQGFDVWNASVVGEVSPHDISTSRAVSRLAKLALARMPEPFFLFLHYFDPHAWYVDHPDFQFGDPNNRTDLDRYDGEIAYTDNAFGRVMRTLGEERFQKNTIIAVMADHGEEFGDHGGAMHTLTLYEEVLRIPLIISAPGFEPARIRNVVAESDVAPTLLTMAGIPVPDSFSGVPIPFDRHGFLPAPDRVVFAETMEKADKQAIIMGPHKLIRDRKPSRLLLFNLFVDPGETNNRWWERRTDSYTYEKRIDAFYAEDRQEAEKVVLDPETEDALRAMGYLDAAPSAPSNGDLP